MEKRLSVKMTIDEKHRSLFDFIEANMDLFPGFFQYDIQNNILPKLAMLDGFDFYNKEDNITGAHEASPEQFVMQT